MKRGRKYSYLIMICGESVVLRERERERERERGGGERERDREREVKGGRNCQI